ncbi:uncharacterized protein A4U43_C01F3570 [Asparagus officinalis]|uniref:J domain-containing protein n=1 Tax=Asparagus officinalis TaxID=4686 RepID=A0A5P1FN53_ASPOF|nr:uncharacterized protein LOC109847607 [Asparagus officinalis]ONK79163.1 uncharacterized protein A4U43_C01F3570 [Asparagus officinalis]
MGKSSRSSSSKRRKKKSLDTSSSSFSSSSPSSSSESESSDRRRRRKRKQRSSSRHRDISKKSNRISSRSEEKRRKRRKHRPDDDESESETELDRNQAQTLAKSILDMFPNIANDLEQILQMIDSGQGVDVSGIPDESLVKQLKKLFVLLKLKRNESGVFLLPELGHCTLDIIGPILCSHLKARDEDLPNSSSPIREQSSKSERESVKNEVDADVARVPESLPKNESPTPPRRRVIGPEMPSRELLAAAAELTDAENLLREADMEDELLIGPPPPAVVAEAESANEAERFEEVARIADAEVEKPYDILGVNWKMSSDNIKKRYWKLSLLVHPDKCSHPQAQQAFVKLNQAFKDLQDSTKREAIDEKIKLKEEQEKFKIELQELREAAQWRRLQGISMEGDEELLALTKEPPKRDEWMTTLPPERKPGVTMQSRAFSKTAKGRGDTSVWTDSPLDRVEKAKQNYLEAYDRTKALAEADDTKKSADADLVDKYNSAKRSKTLVQKHQEEKSSRRVKKKSKQPAVGQHPWKPWDRENDLTAGRKPVNLDSKGMTEGLSSRFSSGNVQRNFL